MLKQLTEQKIHGAFYTPYELARFLARRIIRSLDINALHTINVLDPACGDGELLNAFAETLPSNCHQRTTLLGVETNTQSLEETRKRLDAFPVKQVRLEQGNFLDICTLPIIQQELFSNAQETSEQLDMVDIIIANPPYVRTQTLGAVEAQRLAQAFGLTGRVDLYYAFLVAMTHQLVPGGILGVITSNRFLFTQSGSAIREFLSREYEIIEVIDLGDTKLFDAAVLPAIFTGKKRLQQQPAVQHDTSFSRIYEKLTPTDELPDATRNAQSIYDALQEGVNGDYTVAERHFSIAHGTLVLPASPDDPWHMVTSEEHQWLTTIDKHMRYRIGDVVKVRVGIKTTADEVFIRDDWQSMPEEVQPEAELLRPLLSQEQSARWLPNISDAHSRQVLYTHTIRDGKRVVIDLKHYPKAAAYLTQHYARLAGRKYVLDAKRQWYEIWVPQHPLAWQQPKIVFPDISPAPRFFYDDQECVVDGNCYWIIAPENQSSDILFLIAGIANSRLMTRYHDLAFNNKLYAGRRRYLTQYVERYPLPDLHSYEGHSIVKLVKDLIFGSLTIQEKEAIENEIEKLVAHALGIEPCL